MKSMVVGELDPLESEDWEVSDVHPGLAGHLVDL